MMLPCAWCGPREAAEFHCVGESTPRPDPRSATRLDWRAYLYLRSNPCGWTTETWYHRMGCRRYLVVERHTDTNEIRAVRQAGGQGQ
jgi:heterotetrameric sarcosine oxidase delta subunit